MKSEQEKAEGIESSHKKSNNSPSIDRSDPFLKETRGFLFLLLHALRKHPRYTTVNGVLYRGIRAHVQTEADPNSPKTKPYAKGKREGVVAFHLHDRGP